jgi:hypothetical protein
VAAVRSGNTYTVYINGVANATTSTGANTINNLSGADANKRLRIGARGGVSMGCGVDFYKGNIDEIRFWNVARSGTEIQQNYNVEIDAASNSNLVAYYTMNQGIANGTNTGLTTLIDQKGTNNGTLTNFSLTGSTANYVSQYSSLIVLPLKWLSFTAQRKNETVLLQWSTASEINTSDFAVEHSANGRDWQSISTLPATGNSNHIQKYSYTDAAPIAGMNWYRIKQRDNDGKYSYSEIATIRVNKNQLLNVLGNPVTNGVLHIQINQSTPQLVSLFSSEGKLLWTRQLVPGKHSINVAQMPRGTYLLRYGSYSEALMFE